MFGGSSFLLALSMVPALHAQPYSVPNSTAGGVGTSTNSQYSVSGTVGQPATSESSAGEFKISSGFWNTVSSGGPVVSAPIPDLSAVVGQVPTTFSVHPYFADYQDTDSMMSYTVANNSAPSVASASAINPHDGLLTITFGSTGTTEITIRATNSRGQSVADTFTVTVLPPFVLHTEDLFEDSELVTWGIKLSEPSDPTGTSLTVTAVSSDPALVPGSDGVFTLTHPGGGNDWLLHIRPASEMNGNLAITIVVTGPTGELKRYNAAIRVFSVNDPPTVTILGDQSAIADGVKRTIANFATITSMGSANESSQSASFLMSTDSTAMFASQPQISTTGALSYTPKIGVNGTALVTVVTRDNGGTSSGGINSTTNSFTIAITQPNRAPTITGPSTITIIEDAATGLLPVQLGDLDDPSGTSLTLSASSGSPSTVPASGFELLGSGNDRFVRITPAPDQFDNVIITLTVTDPAGATAVRTFTLRVLSSNDGPTFTSGSDFLVQTNSGAYMTTWATGLSPGPANEASQTVSFIVTNNNTALFISSGQPKISPLGVLSFTVAPNKIGTATVSVVMKDNGGVANGGQNTGAMETFAIAVGHLVYVRTDGSDANNGAADTAASAKRTVQAAINTATPGGHIFVGPGVFTGPIVVNKTVNLLGARAGVDARDRSGAETVLTLASGTTTMALQANNIVVDGFSFENPNSVQGVVALETSVGISGYQLWNNRIMGNSVGMKIASSGQYPVVISQNLVTANNQAGPTSGHGIYLNSFLTNAVISDTIISSHAAVGIYAEGTGVTSVTMSGLQVTSNQEGVRVASNVFGPLVLNNGTIAGNATFGLNNLGPIWVNAAGNWWGSESGPAAASNPDGTGDLVFGNVLLDSFLTAPPF